MVDRFFIFVTYNYFMKNKIAKKTCTVVRANCLLMKRGKCMAYNSKITGSVIRRLREERHLTQEVLSGLAGIARSHLAMIEKGNKSANVETLAKLSSTLGMPLSEFFRIVENETF